MRAQEFGIQLQLFQFKPRILSDLDRLPSKIKNFLKKQ